MYNARTNLRVHYICIWLITSYIMSKLSWSLKQYTGPSTASAGSGERGSYLYIVCHTQNTRNGSNRFAGPPGTHIPQVSWVFPSILKISYLFSEWKFCLIPGAGLSSLQKGPDFWSWESRYCPAGSLRSSDALEKTLRWLLRISNGIAIYGNFLIIQGLSIQSL